MLRGGDHARIERWRRAQALHRTLRYRPDLVEAAGGLTEVDRGCWKSSLRHLSLIVPWLQPAKTIQPTIRESAP